MTTPRQCAHVSPEQPSDPDMQLDWADWESDTEPAHAEPAVAVLEDGYGVVL